MEDNLIQYRSYSPEERRVVRTFSTDAASSSSASNVVQAVADFSNEEREYEAARWQPRYYDTDASK
jgi:hypothetical protein